VGPDPFGCFVSRRDGDPNLADLARFVRVSFHGSTISVAGSWACLRLLLLAFLQIIFVEEGNVLVLLLVTTSVCSLLICLLPWCPWS
jgi:hypothetical protein